MNKLENDLFAAVDLHMPSYRRQYHRQGTCDPPKNLRATVDAGHVPATPIAAA